jgi:hypothetical protein
MNKHATAVTRNPLLVLQALLVIGCASGRLPEAGDEGLVKITQTRFDAVYEAPDFDLDAFGKIVVDECTVRFRDNWQRDQNRERGPAEQVTTEDMQRIERRLAASCSDIFAAALEKTAVVEGGASGAPRILTVRPAIVDLDIAAPDVPSSGRQTDFTVNAVRMNLRLELVDSATEAIVGRMTDNRRAEQTMVPRQTSSVGNMADADRILRQWAGLVREQLDAAAD